MLRRPVILLLLVLLAGAASAQAQEIMDRKVAVLPVTVVSKEPMPQVAERLRQLMEKRLQSEGYSVIDRGRVDGELAKVKKPLDEDLAQEIGRQVGAEAVLFATLVRVGDSFSLTVRLWDLTGKQPAATLTAQGTGLAAVDGMGQRVAQEAGLKLVGKERIARIEVRGNRRIERDAILGAMKVREGELFVPRKLQDDLKTIYKMGYFTDVRFEVTDRPEGRVLIVVVAEKPAIKDVTVTGSRKFKAKKIKETMDLKPFVVASETAITAAIKKVEALYRDKGYIEAKITYRLKPVAPNEAILEVTVQEGARIYIREIKFEGNRAFKGKQLQKVMETKTKGWLSRLTGSGVLNRENLDRDLEKIAAFYYNHGYIKARVGEPKIEVRQGRVLITIPVFEGPQYRVGKVFFKGELIEDEKKLTKRLEIIKKKIYSREVMQQDLTTLQDVYADQGFANADITPMLKEDEKQRTVDITFDIRKGRKVRFERIEITGNIKTRDKVIRRELRIYEQDQFSATKLKESVRNLRRLEYFEEVNFSTSPGSAPDRMNLKITVKERPTGTFGLGAGYSTQDKIVGLVEVSQSNLFGRGQMLRVQGIIGAISRRFRLSFVEPYLFDRPLAMGMDAFNWRREYPEYTQESKGGVIRFSHPLRWKYTRLYVLYRFENVDLTNLAPNASPVLREASRIHNTSAFAWILRRDSRDALFFPTKGSDNSITMETAGLGGDTAFNRFVAESGWYFPIRWGTVFVLHGRMGYLQKLPYGALPSYEKFYLGGIDTIRGFKFADISPRDPRTGERIGGEKFVQLNVEYRFPIYKKLGLMGTVFFDAGQVYRNNEPYFTSFRTSVGTGIRWFSPMGPLRIEWGYNLSPKPWERHSAWEFTIGSIF